MLASNCVNYIHLFMLDETLVGKGQRLDLQEIWLTQHTVDVDTEGVRCEFGVESGTQPSKRMSMVGLDVQLLRELAIDGLNDLANRVVETSEFSGQLLFLITSRQCAQADSIKLPEFGCFVCADVALVTDDLQIGVFRQEFKADVEVGSTGRRQFEIENQAVHGNEQVQLVAKDGHLLGRDFAKVSTMGRPVTGRGRRQVKLHRWHGQAVDHTVVILGNIQL